MILQEKFRMWLLRWAHVEPCMSFFSVEIKRQVTMCKWEGLRCIRCYTLSGSFKQHNHNLLYSTWNSAQGYVPAWMGEGLGGKWIYTCVAEFLETTTLSIGSALRCASSRSRAQLFETPRTVACQASLSMGFSRQEYWSGLPYPPPRDLPNPGIEPRSPSLQVDSLPSKPPGKPENTGVGSLFLLPDPGIKLGFPALQADSLAAQLPGKPRLYPNTKQKV